MICVIASDTRAGLFAVPQPALGLGVPVEPLPALLPEPAVALPPVPPLPALGPEPPLLLAPPLAPLPGMPACEPVVPAEDSPAPAAELVMPAAELVMPAAELVMPAAELVMPAAELVAPALPLPLAPEVPPGSLLEQPTRVIKKRAPTVPVCEDIG